MGNVIASLKNAIKSISNMTTQFVTEFTKIDKYVVVTLPSSLFSFLFKIPSQSPPFKLSRREFRPRFHQVEGLHCLLNETQKSLSLNDNEDSGILNDSKALVFIRKRKVTNITPVVRTNKFLFNCFECNKNLSGQDIYIYRYACLHINTI